MAAEGRIAGELLCPYPPGIPVVLHGERITMQALQILRAAKDSGGKILGCSDSSSETILVVDENSIKPTT